jgi:hypothetical protein
MEWSTRSGRFSWAMAAILAGSLALGLGTPARAEGCPLMTVVIEGDEPARTAIADAVERAGILVTPEPGCSFETVHVAVQGGTFVLTIVDPYGRISHRTITDLEAAAAVVESTPGSDALLPLLPETDTASPPIQRPDPLAVEDTDDAALPTEPAPPPAALVNQPHPSERTPASGLSLSMATEVVTGIDGSSWAGASVSGCVELGPTCLGTRVRFWTDLEPEEESGNTIHQRSAGEIALSLGLPLSLRRLTLRPAAELGLGWVHMGNFAVSPQRSDDADSDQGGLLAGAHLSASYPLTGRWGLEGGLGVTLSVFGHQGPFTVAGTKLPGEPYAFGIVSLGLRYGGS